MNSFSKPPTKSWGWKWWARAHEQFYAAQNLKIIFKSYAFLQNSLRDFWIFIISHILNFWKMLFRSLKKVCDEFSKIKNLRCTFFFVFRGIWLFFRIQTCLVVNWPRKWAVLHFYKNSKISQNVLQKSTTFQNDFLIFGRLKKFLCPSTSFSTPDFLLGASWKALNFMIAFDHKLISSDLYRSKVILKYQ